jgi:hypothetical protein
MRVASERCQFFFDIFELVPHSKLDAGDRRAMRRRLAGFFPRMKIGTIAGETPALQKACILCGLDDSRLGDRDCGEIYGRSVGRESNNSPAVEPL